MAEHLVVFDCVVFLQSLISEAGPAARCLELFEQGKFSIAVSREVLSEIREVLSRSGLRKRYPRLTDQRVDRLIDVLLYRGKLFRQIKRHYEYPRDPYDEAYLSLAIEARADFLITRDNDLLDLMKWETEEGREFQRRFRRLKIVDPVAFLSEIEQQRP
ncbi:MAG: putative toxin-antitoxin system toxin component, PIN family [Acidobacteriota bacterium]